MFILYSRTHLPIFLAIVPSSNFKCVRRAFFSVMLSHRLQCDRILRYHILTFDYTLSMNIEQFTCANTFEFFCRDRLGYTLPVLPITTKNVHIDRQCKYIPYICFFIYSNKKRKCKKPQILSIFAASI